MADNFIDLTSEDSPVRQPASSSSSSSSTSSSAAAQSQSSNLPPPVSAGAIQNAARRVLPQSISGMQQGWQQPHLAMASGMANNGMLPAARAAGSGGSQGRVLPLTIQQQALMQQAALMHQNQQLAQHYPQPYQQFQPPLMMSKPLVPFNQQPPQQQYRPPQPTNFQNYYAPQTTITFELANGKEFRVRSEGGEPGRDVVPLMKRARGFRFDRAKNAIFFPLGTSFVTHQTLTEISYK